MTKEEFKKKRENYWYYYKWHTIAGIFALCLIVFFVKDMVTKEKYDANILLTTSYYVDDSQTEALEKKFEEYFTDMDGDGKVTVGITPIYIEGGTGGEPQDAQYAYAMQMKLMAEVSAGQSMLYLFDDGFTDMFINQAGPTKIEDNFPGNTEVKGSVWNIAASEIGEQTFIKDYKKATGVELHMSLAGRERFTKKDEIERYNKNLEALENMINNKKVNTKV